MNFTTPRYTAKNDVTLAVLASVRTWNNYNLLWVHGPAGVGKTTIIRDVFEILQRKFNTKSSGAYFFLSRKNKVTDSGKLFASLAHDLARRNPGLAPHIQKAFHKNPEISNLSLMEQCSAFLIDPIHDWAQHTNENRQLIMIVDGLDACDGGEPEHLKIINTIHQSFSRLAADCVKWQWVISSRPEAWIRSALDMLTTDHRIQTIPVPHIFQRDVEDYISSSLRGISGREERLDILRWHSTGYFAYAASLVAYINSPAAGRAVRFRSVIAHSEHASFKHEQVHMFSQLDEMYHDILTGVPPLLRDQAKRILGAISVVQPASLDGFSSTTFMLSELLGISVEALYDALYYLHSVVTAPLRSSSNSECSSHNQDFTNSGLTFYHKSFNEFLRNSSRSRDWCLDVPSTHADLAKCCLKRLSGKADGDNQVYKYAATRWFIHCWRIGMNSHVPSDVEVALGMLPELYEFDYTLLPRHELVDRYFVEWLLWLQDLAMSEYLVLNPGPPHSLEDPSNYSTFYPQKLPPRATYILGIEPSNQVLLVPTFENKRGQPDPRIYALGPQEKRWDWIRGFKIIPLAEATQIGHDGNTIGERLGEGSSGPRRDAIALRRGTNLGEIGGELDYDELVARSLAWEEENLFGGFVTSEDEMAALVAALSATEEPPSTDTSTSEGSLEGVAQNHALIELATAAEDMAAVLPESNDSADTILSSEDEKGDGFDVTEDTDTEVCLSTGWSSPSSSEEMVVLTSQSYMDAAVDGDKDSDFELVEYEEILH